MKILVVWVGAVVPAYRLFFEELAENAEVEILAPKKWRHGSVDYPGEESIPVAAAPYRLSYAAFWPRGSRYLVPGLAAHLLRIRPDVVYFMDELDRLNLAIHIALVKRFAPDARIATFALQNIARPGYHRWSHRLALTLNRKKVDGVIAASRLAGETIVKQGYKGPWIRIPLSVSPTLFTPVDPIEKERIRTSLGLASPFTRIILYAGSLSEAKGMSLLAKVLPRFPQLLFLAAGDGPMRSSLQQTLGSQFRWLGPLRDKELIRFYQSGDYVILPSLDTPSWKEQVGRSLIEGIFCGCLGLGSDSGNIPDVVGSPELIFRQNDAESLASLLSSLPLREEDALRKQQGRHTAQHFSHPVCARKTYEFLSRLIPGGP